MSVRLGMHAHAVASIEELGDISTNVLFQHLRPAWMCFHVVSNFYTQFTTSKT